MSSLKITLPIYYEIEYKTKKNKTVLIGLNWYRNVFFHTNNKVKEHYHNLVKEQLNGESYNKVKVHYKVYLKRRNTDGHNIRSIVEKYALDGLVENKVIVDDSLDYVIGTTSEFFLDKDNPRMEITIEEIL